MNLHIIFAWLSFIILIALLSLYPLRIYIENHKNISDNTLYSYSFIKKYHKILSLLLFIIILLHGKLAMQRPNIEAILCFCFLILIFITYPLRPKLKKHWLIMHKVLSILLILTTIWHIIASKV